MKWFLEESIREDRLGNKTLDIDILDEDGCVITSLECEEEFGLDEISEFRRDATMIALAPQLYELAMALSKPNFSMSVLEIAQMSRDAMELARFEQVQS